METIQARVENGKNNIGWRSVEAGRFCPERDLVPDLRARGDAPGPL